MTQRIFSPEEQERLYEHYKPMLKRRDENPDEYWIANWWMGKFVSSVEFDRIILEGPIPKWFDAELKAHYIDWLEGLSDEAFQEHLDRQTNLVLF